MGAYLSASGSNVTGTAVLQMAFPTDCVAGCCGGPFSSFSRSLTGTVDAGGKLKLTSAVANGGPVFAMSGTVMNGALANGTYTLTGPCPASGAFTGTEYPTLNGTYAGTLTSKNTGTAFTVTANLANSSIPRADGFFDVTSSATLSGYPCIRSATAAMPLDQNSGAIGNQFSVSMTGNQGGDTVLFGLSGTLSQDGKTIHATYTAGGACRLDIGTGTLTLQP